VKSQRLTLRQRNRLLTMRLVQSTAMDMFERDGYEKSTIEDVAAACGVSASTIYRHFTTKENVVLWDERDSVIDDELGRLLGSLPPIQAFRDAVVAALADREDVELFRRRLRLIYSQPSIWSVAALQDRQNRSELARAFALTAGRNAPSLRDESLAAVCLVALDIALERWQGGREREPLATLIDRSLTSVFESR
jgi:AcrR family transcriptional regulator